MGKVDGTSMDEADGGSVDEADGGSVDKADATSVKATIVQYDWKQTWGPCRQGEVCVEELVATPSGSLAYNLEGVMASATMSASDTAAFDQFLADPALQSAIAESQPCLPPVLDTKETLVLTLSDSPSMLSKEITPCHGPTFDAIRQWNAVFRGYFR